MGLLQRIFKKPSNDNTKSNNNDKDLIIKTLQKKVSVLEQQLKERENRSSISLSMGDSASRSSEITVETETVKPRGKFKVSNNNLSSTSLGSFNNYARAKENIIGKGSFGAVYLATDVNTGRHVAIKKIKKHRGKYTHKDANDKIMNEIFMLTKLGNHPFIIRLFERIDSETDTCLVFEYCKGGPIMEMRKNIKEDPYSEDRICYYMRQLILGLEHLQSYNIVHCDIKPENILLTQGREQIRLADFGSAVLNLPGMKVQGTPQYMAPEVTEIGTEINSMHGFAIDMWSLGITMYCLATGKHPMEHKSIGDIYNSEENESIQFSWNLTPSLRTILKHLLQTNPKNRATLSDCRVDKWFTKNGKIPLPDNINDSAIEAKRLQRELSSYRRRTISTDSDPRSSYESDNSKKEKKRRASDQQIKLHGRSRSNPMNGTNILDQQIEFASLEIPPDIRERRQQLLKERMNIIKSKGNGSIDENNMYV